MTLARGATVLASSAANLLCATAVVGQIPQQLPGSGYFETAAPVAIGFAANAPRQVTGISLLVFGRPLPGWGFYVDAKRTPEAPQDRGNFEPTLSVEDPVVQNDLRLGDTSVWRSVNLGVTRRLSGTFLVYAGAGYSQQNAYAEYFDDSEQRGDSGVYWLEDSLESGDRLNLMVGGWMRLTGRLLFQFGGEMKPPGFTVGLFYALWQ